MQGGTAPQTTMLGRGTSGYRAPELLNSVKPTFTNKADIWSLGCILHKLSSGTKIFESDWAAREWAVSMTGLRIDASGHLNYLLDMVIRALLQLDPAQRPTAASVAAVFANPSEIWLYSSSVAAWHDDLIVRILEGC